MTIRLDGIRALVTGSTAGIGLATARVPGRRRREGRVIVTGRDPRTGRSGGVGAGRCRG